MATRLALLLAVAGALAGCTSYEADPVRPLEILRELDALRIEDVTQAEVAPILTSFDASDGLSLLEASAIAVRRNPTLAALRARVGVAEARLIQAGLLSDPVIGWSAGDPLADLIIEGKVDGASWLTGASLSWQVPRPGEIDAKEGAAKARIRVNGAQLARAEWALVREVHLAYARLLVAQARLAQNERLSGIAQQTLKYFARARAAGAATALDEALARVAANTVQANLLSAKSQRTLARQNLNGLLGLSPDREWNLQDSLSRFVPQAPSEDLKQLVSESLERRPDLQEIVASYEQAEERLRLEVAGQWPQLQIGTGISISLPIFSRFNQPAIETALRSRTAARLRVRAAVQQTRREIHAALTRAEQAYVLLDLFRTSLGPQSEETLKLTEKAFKAREVTPLQILTAQRQVLDTQSRFLAAQQAWAEARIRLDSACGRLLPSARTPLPPTSESEEESK